MYWLISYKNVDGRLKGKTTLIENIEAFTLFNTENRKAVKVGKEQFIRMITNRLIKNAAILCGEIVTYNNVGKVGSVDYRRSSVTVIEYSDEYFITVNNVGQVGVLSYMDARYRAQSNRITNIELAEMKRFLDGTLMNLSDSIEYVSVDRDIMKKIRKTEEINDRNRVTGIGNTMYVGSDNWITLMGSPNSIVYDKCSGIIDSDGLSYSELEFVKIQGDCSTLPDGFISEAAKLRFIRLPDGIKSMGVKCLSHTGMEVIDLRPYKEIEHMGELALQFNGNLRELYYPDNETYVNAFLVWSNPRLEVVWLPRNCKYLNTLVGKYANNVVRVIVLPETKCMWNLIGSGCALRTNTLEEIHTNEVNLELAEYIKSICNKEAKIIVKGRE